MMKIIATSDWHIGNVFHSNDRLPEHRHFLGWLLDRLEEQKPDALLIAGDVFDNGNPSAAAQRAYYEFLADAIGRCPDMNIVITAGNHDSAMRLEAASPILARNNVQIRGNVRRTWDEGKWIIDYDDLIIPLENAEGEKIVILAMPYLRSDMINGCDYSNGVNDFMRTLTARAKELHPGCTTLLMAHMYAKGAEIAEKDASEKIIIGGQEEVNMEGWTEHPDYLTCGHIHKRQHIWNTDWARYTGSILPMSFSEVEYKHGVDMITFGEEGKREVEFIEYEPQHKLVILPKDEEGVSVDELKKLIKKELRNRGEDGKLSETYDYVLLKVRMDKVNNDAIREMEDLFNTKDAVLCKTQKVIESMDLSTIRGNQQLTSIDDILNRDPMDTLVEAFAIKHNAEMSEQQKQMLREIINSCKIETE